MERVDATGFRKFYHLYYNRCFLFAKSYVFDDWVAEDIASEALIKIWEITKTKEIENPKVLLFTIVKHKSLDYLKHESVKQNTLANLSEYGKRELDIRISTLEASDPEKIFASDIQQIIQQSLDRLPEQTRQIFEMNRFQNLSKKEIADSFGITIKGVDYHLSKALKVLRENLKDYLPILLFFAQEPINRL
ncbi:RNA polymerase sigma-70 factor [Parabacteroides sp. OttesenSCG-928-B22]|nr:RNA polymerase sigma-70 factor [Parabacteroides sp. OttesenSCG-928-B22]